MTKSRGTVEEIAKIQAAFLSQSSLFRLKKRQEQFKARMNVS
jgi:hypothetical protein